MFQRVECSSTGLDYSMNMQFNKEHYIIIVQLTYCMGSDGGGGSSDRDNLYSCANSELLQLYQLF